MNAMDAAYVPDPRPLPEPMPPGIDLRLLLRKFLLGLPIILVMGVSGLIGARYLLDKLPHKYSTSVAILLDPKQPGSYGAAGEFGAALVDNSKISSVEIVLQSTALLKEVADRLHLADNPLYGGYQPSRLHTFLDWVLGRKPAAVADTAEEREGRAIGRLWSMMRPSRVGITYVIRLDVTGPNAADVARIAQAWAETYIDDLTKAKLEAAQRDASWLSERLTVQREELIKSELAIAAIQRKVGLVGGSAKEDGAADRQAIGSVNQQVIGVQDDIASLQSRYRAAEALRAGGGDLTSLPDVANSPVIQDLRRKLGEALEKIATLSTRYSSGYPAMKQAMRDEAALRSLMAQEARRIVESLKTQYETALAHKNVLSAEVNRLVGKATATANAESRAELLEAERVAEANRSAYEASQNKLREVLQQESRLDVEARILSAPDVPDGPSFPKAVQILPAGTAFGLLLGTGLALLLPLAKSRIESAEDVERHYALPVLGALPFLPASKLRHKRNVISLPEYVRLFPFSAFAESMKLTRYRLKTMLTRGRSVIQVTSAVPGEGKSTVAASLAVSAASAHMRTALVDLDFHRAAASRLLGNASTLGIVNYLQGDAPPEAALTKHDSLPMVSVSAGTYDAVRAGLIENGQLVAFIARLRQDYELVIIDTPPVLALSDAVFVSSLADATLFVMACRDTPKTLVDKAIRILRSSGAPLTGVVLNKVTRLSGLTYGAENYGYSDGVVVEPVSLPG